MTLYKHTGGSSTLKHPEKLEKQLLTHTQVFLCNKKPKETRVRKCEEPSPFLQAKWKGQMTQKDFSSLTLGNHQRDPYPWGEQGCTEHGALTQRCGIPPCPNQA